MIRGGVGVTRTGVLWHMVHIPAHLVAHAFSSLQRMYEPGGVFDTPLRSSFDIKGLEFLTPGGGGPGSVVTSTTPPSIEEVGRMITSPPASEQTARAKILKKTRCPPGHHWSYRHKRCVETKKYHFQRQRRWNLEKD